MVCVSLTTRVRQWRILIAVALITELERKDILQLPNELFPLAYYS